MRKSEAWTGARLLPAAVPWGIAAAALALGAGPALADWALHCDDATQRCTSQSALVSETGAHAGTFGLQLGKDGSDAVVFVTTPLGVALGAGLRLRAGQDDIALSFDVCYPDGCRASAELAPAALAALLGHPALDLLLFSYGKETPIALTVPLGGLRESLAGSVALGP